MSVEIVDRANKRKAVIEKYLKNREILKERQLNEKINKQTFQRDVATKLQKPVVEQAKKVAEKAQEKQDELQNALIQQLQDNQANIISQLGLDYQLQCLNHLQHYQRLKHSQQYQKQMWMLGLITVCSNNIVYHYHPTFGDKLNRQQWMLGN